MSKRCPISKWRSGSIHSQVLLHRTASTWLLATTACAAACGCSDSPFELAPVAGAVTIDGQTFSQGKVMFAPVAKGDDGTAGRPAFGMLDANGRFELGTYDRGDGAVVGEHWVTVIRLKPEGAPGTPPVAAARKEFSRVTSPTRVTVVAGQDNTINVVLTRDDVARFGVFDD